MSFYKRSEPLGNDENCDFDEIFEREIDGVPALDFGEFSAEVLDLTRKVFAQKGWLQKFLKMENRPQQTRMANAVAETFSSGNSLLFEAGTGVGKSLAYLVPGLIFSKLSRKKFVVSTNTILLQEQILKKDLELCRKLFGSVPALKKIADFKVVSMLGKANYLCGTRLAEALRNHDGIFDGSDGSAAAQELKMIKNWWAEENCAGTREHLPKRVSEDVWESVNADSKTCSRKNCSPKNCAYQRARAALENADLVVVNHNLLFALVGAGAAPAAETSGILYPNDFVVLDEAHRVPEIATEYFGARTSSYAIQRLLSRIASATKKNGVLSKNRGELEAALSFAKEKVEEFFTNIRFEFFKEEKAMTRRFRERNWAENLCEIPLGNVEKRLKSIAEVEERVPAKDEINDFAEKIQAHRLAIRECLELKNAPEYVYWAELSAGTRRTISLSGAPIDVAELLAEALFEKGTSAVFSSATLSDSNGEMARFKTCCVADLAGIFVKTGREESPVDYAKNMEIFVAEDCPAPENDAENVAYNAEIAANFVNALPSGGTLILSTSFDFCSKIAAELLKIFGNEREIFVQESGVSRHEITRKFIESGNGILIGNQSFWTGIDVPGSALSQVILTRLPFANPAIPLVEAKIELLRERGKIPFFEMTLPDAEMLFRQGIGRLIRKSNDRGRLILTDSRLVKKPYGKHFLSALPHQKYVRFSKDVLKFLLKNFE